MSASKKTYPADIVLAAYHKHSGNKTAAADEIGCHRQTFRNLLKLYGADKRPLVGGTTKPLKHNVLPLPPKGKIYTYLCTSAQNNTKVFAPFLKNLEVYSEFLKKRGDCRIMVSRFTYNKNQFVNPKSQKPGDVKPDDADECWYDPAILSYVCDDVEEHGTCRWQLAPDMWFCSDMNIIPTATRPLSDLQTYTGSDSCVFPHSKIAIEAVPTMPGQPTKHIYTTGTITGRNYIKKKAGLKAEFHHTFAAALIEVNSEGDWWLRHLNADNNGTFFDCPGGTVIKICNGEIITKGQRLEAINWGDIHCEDVPRERQERYWIGTKKQPAAIDLLKPKYQFVHDFQSFHARSHHDMDSFTRMLEKYIEGKDDVEKEIDHAADFLSSMDRSFCTTVVVRSNHHDHSLKWLDKADYRWDQKNIEIFLEAQLTRVRAIKAGEKDWSFFEWSMKRAGCPETVRFLKKGERFTICNKTHPISCEMHGHEGPNGSRGSNANMSRIGVRLNKGHGHDLCARDGLWSQGTCAEEQHYNEGKLSSWSISHVGTYENGKRFGLTERSGKLWA